MINRHVAVTYGSDPEGFFASTEGEGDKIVGAEKVLPVAGLGEYYQNRIVLDGVQFEMHPYASSTIHELGGRISHGFKTIAAHLKQKEGKFKVDFRQVVKIDDDELKSLSEGARKLGCQPSENFYRKRPINVPEGYPVRSAAGHIHLGLTAPIWNAGNYGSSKAVDYRRHLVPLLDIFVGNTCVLLDRDPMAAVRRQLYGHAGEWRKQPHGMEYRTTSNFWLKSYGLMELVFGLADFAVQILATSIRNETSDGFQPEKILAEKMNMRKVERAIETNNAKMAMQNWLMLVPFFKEYVDRCYANNGAVPTPIHKDNVDQVTEFLKLGAKDKLTPFLASEPVGYWSNLFTHQMDRYGERATFVLQDQQETWPNLLKHVTAKPAAPKPLDIK